MRPSSKFQSVFPFFKKHSFLMVLILIQSLILYYRFYDLPLSHDELSALFRCRFESFSELIDQGVKPDGHPAGVQVFLWCMTQTFGYQVWLLKLPFLLAGTLSLILLFKITEDFFDTGSAFLASTLFICSNFYISHWSSIRPYSPGLMFNLSTLYFLLQLSRNSKKGYLVLVFLSVLGSFYTHYFSFLQSLLLVTFYPFFHKIDFKRVFGLLAFSLLCFLPHLELTKYQLGLAGLGWLQVPDKSFVLNFILHLFNYSWLYAGLAMSFLLMAFFRMKILFRRKVFLLLMAFIPGIIIGLYSFLRAPVLQEPALVFSSPFLLILMSSAVYQNKKSVLIGVCCLLIGLFTLLATFHLFEKRFFQSTKAFIENSNAYKKKHPQKKILLLWQGNSAYFKLYTSILKSDLRVVFTENQPLSNINLREFDEVICNHLPPELMFALDRHFSHCDILEYNLLYEYIRFSRTGVNNSLYQTEENVLLSLDSSEVWGSSITFDLNDSIFNTFQEFKVIHASDTSHVECVYEIFADTLRLQAGRIPFDENTVVSVKLKDVYAGRYLNSKKLIKLYLHRMSAGKRESIQVLHLQRPDNPIEYSGKINFYKFF